MIQQFKEFLLRNIVFLLAIVALFSIMLYQYEFYGIVVFGKVILTMFVILSTGYVLYLMLVTKLTKIDKNQFVSLILSSLIIMSFHAYYLLVENEFKFNVLLYSILVFFGLLLISFFKKHN